MSINQNVLLTGRPGIGKTTVIHKFITRYLFKTGGFFTREIREHGTRVGFTIEAISSWNECRQDSDIIQRAVLAHVKSKSPFRLGRYGVNVSAMEEVGIAALRDGLRKAELIIIDEIGRMEMYSQQFQKEVVKVLDAPVSVLGVIQKYSTPFLNTIRERKDVNIIVVTHDNREILPEKLFDFFNQNLSRIKN